MGGNSPSKLYIPPHPAPFSISWHGGIKDTITDLVKNLHEYNKGDSKFFPTDKDWLLYDLDKKILIHASMISRHPTFSESNYLVLPAAGTVHGILEVMVEKYAPEPWGAADKKFAGTNIPLWADHVDNSNHDSYDSDLLQPTPADSIAETTKG